MVAQPFTPEPAANRKEAPMRALAHLAATLVVCGVLLDAQAVIPPGPYTPGASYFGRAQYIEYIAGNLPVIFSAPHGGNIRTAEITDRTATNCGGTTNFAIATDRATWELTLAIKDAFRTLTGGRYPHIIINRLSRVELDPNRTKDAGACKDAEARIAWDEYHAFIDAAKNRVIADYRTGWFSDVHGHGHAIPRIELGFLTGASTLRKTDGELDATSTYQSQSSFRTLSEISPLTFSALLRGNTSLGTLLARAGYPAVPSASDPAPGTADPYFNGGYTIGRHGCSAGGSICGAQLEHYSAVRDAINRPTYAAALAKLYQVFLAQNFGISLVSTAGEIMVDDDDANNDSRNAAFRAPSSWSPEQTTNQHLNSHHVATGAGPTLDGAEFFFAVPAPGRYSVYAWWTSNATRSTSASYRVFETEGGRRLLDTKVNQQLTGSRWNLLGTWDFTVAGRAKVYMSRSLSGAGTLSADAIRAVRR
jgi:hypothetical protein